MRFLLLTSAGCGVLVALDATPGLFSSGLLCPCCSVLVLVVAMVGWGVYACRHCDDPAIRILAATVVVATCILWLTYVPSRVALWIVRKDFESLLADAPKDDWIRPERKGRWVGCFYVYEYLADAHGGVYFRTASHADGIGPDAMNYGFAFRPSKTRCPFGGKGYTTIWLFGDWYWFSVSDD